MLLQCLHVLHLKFSLTYFCVSYLFLFAPFFPLLFSKNMLLNVNIATFPCQSDGKLGALAGLCSSGGFVLSQEEAYTRCVSP